METVLDIITKIHHQKQAKNIFPDYATKTEIWEELFRQMDDELIKLSQEGKIEKGENIRNNYYKIL